MLTALSGPAACDRGLTSTARSISSCNSNNKVNIQQMHARDSYPNHISWPSRTMLHAARSIVVSTYSTMINMQWKTHGEQRVHNHDNDRLCALWHGLSLDCSEYLGLDSMDSLGVTPAPVPLLNDLRQWLLSGDGLDCLCAAECCSTRCCAAGEEDIAPLSRWAYLKMHTRHSLRRH